MNVYFIIALILSAGLSFSGREFDDLNPEGQREACLNARYESDYMTIIPVIFLIISE